MVIRLYENNPRLSEIERIADMLRNGGVVIYPTDTVYAIGCDALNVRAAERICKLKGINPLKSNLSIIGHDISSLSRYVKINDWNFKLIRNNTPGPFTFILPTASGLPKLYKNRKSVEANTVSVKNLRKENEAIKDEIADVKDKLAESEKRLAEQVERAAELARRLVDCQLYLTSGSKLPDVAKESVSRILDGKAVSGDDEKTKG